MANYLENAINKLSLLFQPEDERDGLLNMFANRDISPMSSVVSPGASAVNMDKMRLMNSIAEPNRMVGDMSYANQGQQVDPSIFAYSDQNLIQNGYKPPVQELKSSDEVKDEMEATLLNDTMSNLSKLPQEGTAEGYAQHILNNFSDVGDAIRGVSPFGFTTNRQNRVNPQATSNNTGVIDTSNYNEPVIDREEEQNQMEQTIVNNQVAPVDKGITAINSYGQNQPVTDTKPGISQADMEKMQIRYSGSKPTSTELGNVGGKGDQGDGEEGGFLSGIGDFLDDEERMLNLALAFNTMRLTPDQGLASAIGNRLKNIQKKGKTSNVTYEKLKKIDPAIAEEYLTGNLTASKALDLATKIRRLDLDDSAPAGFRALELRAEASGLKEGTPEYQKFMMEGGVKKGLALRVGKDGTIEFSETGFDANKPMSEASSNALQFATRMANSENILQQYEQQGTVLFDSMVSNVPIAGNYLRTEEYQKYDQAKRDWVNAVLRKESGAAIAESEFANADKQYFPQPGDTAEVIAQKRRNRELAQATMASTVPGFDAYQKSIQKRLGQDQVIIPQADTKTTTTTATQKQPKKVIRYNDKGQRIN